MIKKLLSIFLLTCTYQAASAQIFPNLGGQRAGISSLTFLKNDVSPRSLGMGGSNTAISGDGYAIFTNPAATIDVNSLAFTASNYMLPAGIQHSFFSAIVPNKNEGAWTVSVISLTSGWMERRTEFQPGGTGEMFSSSNIAIGTGYAKKLSEMFSFGINLKYVNEQLAEYRQHTGMLDLGFLYRTDFKDLKFAVALQHFGASTNLKGDFVPMMFNRRSEDMVLESYPAPTLFKMGVSIVPWKDEYQSILVSAQLNHPNDNAENIRLGIEYNYMDLFYARGGYKINVANEVFPTAGLGLRSRIGRHPLNIDYAVNPTRHLGLLHSIGLTLRVSRTQRETVKSNE